MNITERINDIASKGYTVFDYSKNKSGEFVYTIKCNKCGVEFKKTYYAISTCSNCIKLQKAADNFKHKVKSKFGETFRVIEYCGYKNLAKIKCLTCNNIIEITPENLASRKILCTTCNNPTKKNADKFIEQSKNKFGENAFDYSNLNYKNNSTAVNLHCNTCGADFTMISSTHLNSKTGCKICNAHSSYKMISKESLLNELKDLPVELITDKKYYFKNKEKYEFKCKLCGDIFEKSIMYILKYKQYCPICAMSKPIYELSDVLQTAKCDVNNYEILDDYSGLHKTYKFRCKKHNHEFKTKMSNFLAIKHPCEICRNEAKFNSLVLRLEDKNLTLIQHTDLLHDSEITVKCNNCNTEFKTTWFNVYQSGFGGCPNCYKQTSLGELEVADYVKSLDSNIKVLNNAKIFNYPDERKELDVYVPDFNFAIEYNGNYTHACKSPEDYYDQSKYTCKNQHKYKANLCDNYKPNSIHLFQIFESEWQDPIKQKIWKSKIKLKLNLVETKIYARKCIIKEISNLEYKEFCNNYHLQGYAQAKYKLGLFYNNELVMIASFGKPRFNKAYDYELIRIATKLNTIVVGGASKLFKSFIKTYNPESIISYANRRWSQGNVYNQIGLKFIGATDPGYYIIHNKSTEVLLSRSKFSKKMLGKYYKNKQNLITKFDASKSEARILFANGYFILTDAGNYTFEWIRTNEKT